MKIVLINGYPQSGKDTFIQFCKETGANVFNISTVDPAKKALSILGWHGSKNPIDRKALSDLKDISTKYYDGPFRYIYQRVLEIMGREKDGVIFIHSREPSELTRFKKEFKAIVILIDREIQQEISNHADLNVEKFDYDYIINNEGTLFELKEKALDFMKQIT